MANYKPSKPTTTGTIVLIAVAALIALLLIYLFVVGLVAIAIWAFALEFNPWSAALGVWAILILVSMLFRR